MKALDAELLTSILEGDPQTKDLFRKLRGAEVAATELALLEVSLRAEEAPVAPRRGRRTAAERLRRKLTALPIDGRAVVEAARHASGGLPRGESLLRLAEFGALEAYGCTELFTAARAAPGGKWRFRVIHVETTHTKKRKRADIHS